MVLDVDGYIHTYICYLDLGKATTLCKSCGGRKLQTIDVQNSYHSFHRENAGLEQKPLCVGLT